MLPHAEDSATQQPETDMYHSKDLPASSHVGPSDNPYYDESAFQSLLQNVAARRDEIDQLRHVPRDIVEQMKAAGIFRSSTPAKFGGTGMPPAQFLSLIERIGEVDGSAAWVAAFGSANTYIAALPESAQEKIYATGPDQVYAGGLYPLHKAERVEGGWKVSGRWRFASGCKGADWIGVGLQLPSEDGGAPLAYMAVAPADEIEIIDNWDVLGMQGTGSHDTAVQDKIFPDEWICMRGAKGIYDDPIYHYPPLAFQAQVHAAVNLGLARAAVDLAKAMSGGAKLMPGAASLANRAYFCTHLAKSEANLRAARLLYYAEAEAAWDEMMQTGEVSVEQTNLLRLSATHAAHSAAEVIQTCYRIVGMAAVQRNHRMQQLLRDCLVVTQHAALSEATLEQAGALLAGVAPAAGYP